MNNNDINFINISEEHPYARFNGKPGIIRTISNFTYVTEKINVYLDQGCITLIDKYGKYVSVSFSQIETITEVNDG